MIKVEEEKKQDKAKALNEEHLAADCAGMTEGVNALSRNETLPKLIDSTSNDDGVVTDEDKGGAVTFDTDGTGSDEEKKSDAKDGEVENSQISTTASEEVRSISASIPPSEDGSNSKKAKKSSKRKGRAKKGKSTKRKGSGKKEKSARQPKTEIKSPEVQKVDENKPANTTGSKGSTEIANVPCHDLQELDPLEETETSFEVDQIATSIVDGSDAINDTDTHSCTSVTMTDFDQDEEAYNVLKSSLREAETFQESMGTLYRFDCESDDDLKRGIDKDSTRDNKSKPSSTKSKKRKKKKKKNEEHNQKKVKKKTKKVIKEEWLAGAAADYSAHRYDDEEIIFQDNSSYASDSAPSFAGSVPSSAFSLASTSSAFKSMKTSRSHHMRRTVSTEEDSEEESLKRDSSVSFNQSESSGRRTLKSRKSIRKDLEAQVEVDVSNRGKARRFSGRKSLISSDIFKNARRSLKILEEIEIDIEIDDEDEQSDDENKEKEGGNSSEEQKLWPYVKERICTRKVCKPLLLSIAITVGIVVMLVLARIR